MAVINKSILLISFSIVIIAVLLSNLEISVIFLDFTFMFGLVLFIIGGFIWMIDKGVYNRPFKIFKNTLMYPSKLDTFISENEWGSDKDVSDKRNKSIPLYILFVGLFFTIFSTILSAY